MTDVQPGDLLLTAGKGFAAEVIRLGAAVRDRPNLVNHAIVVHHETGGVLWGIEGRPGGAGWVDCRRAMADRRTVHNASQPGRDAVLRESLCRTVEQAMLGRAYDWTAIARSAVESLRLDRLWSERGLWVEFSEDPRDIPGAVICSALADWAYERAGWANPGDAARTRYTRPEDWLALWIEKGWAEWVEP